MARRTPLVRACNCIQVSRSSSCTCNLAHIDVALALVVFPSQTEKFFLAVADVPNAKAVAEGLLYQANFDERLKEAYARIKLFSTAIDQACFGCCLSNCWLLSWRASPVLQMTWWGGPLRGTSRSHVMPIAGVRLPRLPRTHCIFAQIRNATRLQRMLKAVLVLGNKMNGVTKEERKKLVKAFTVNSLHQLNQTKAFDQQTSVLQYFIKLLKRRDPDLLRLAKVCALKPVVMLARSWICRPFGGGFGAPHALQCPVELAAGYRNQARHRRAQQGRSAATGSHPNQHT